MIEEYAPRVLPPGWHGPMPAPVVPGAVAYRNNVLGAAVILGFEDHGEHGKWLHLSASNLHGSRPLPWAVLSDCRDVFMGDRLAVQILPERKHWINIQSSCLHLFARLDGETVAPVWDRFDE